MRVLVLNISMPITLCYLCRFDCRIAINLAMGCVFAFNESSHAKSDGSFDDRLVAPYVCIDAEPKVDEGTDVINT